MILSHITQFLQDFDKKLMVYYIAGINIIKLHPCV